MFMNFALILFGYLLISVIIPLPLAFKWKGLICVGTLLCAGRLAILRGLFPGYGGVECSKALLVATAFFQGLVILMFLFAIARDIFWLLSFAASLFHKGAAGAWLRAALRGVPFTLGLLGLSALLSGVMLHGAAKVPDVKRQDVFLDNWPRELDGLRVAVLADLHISRFFDGAWVGKVVERTNGLEPELILIPGDLVDGEAGIRRPDVAPIAGLKAEYGTYMCVGNHEYISVVSDWLPAFRKLGIKSLYNSRAEIELKGSKLVLAGVTDPAASWRGLPGPDLSKALKGLPEKGPPVILLDHRPGRAWENSKDGRVALQLSGHTHGGLFPVLSSFVKRANQGFVMGLYEAGPMALYAHPGTGLWSGVPMRLFNPSEITLLTLRSKGSG